MFHLRASENKKVEKIVYEIADDSYCREKGAVN